MLWEQGVGGSNPLAPTSKLRTYGFGCESFLLLGSILGSIWSGIHLQLPLFAVKWPFFGPQKIIILFPMLLHPLPPIKHPRLLYYLAQYHIIQE